MDVSPAARATMRAQCHTRDACGRCGPCRAVLSAARRDTAPRASSPVTEQPPQTAADSVDAPVRPAARDAKAAWVEYAVATGMDRQDAEAMTKTALIEALP